MVRIPRSADAMGKGDHAEVRRHADVSGLDAAANSSAAVILLGWSAICKTHIYGVSIYMQAGRYSPAGRFSFFGTKLKKTAKMIKRSDYDGNI